MVAQALRVGMSYARWAIIISTISGGNLGGLNGSLGVYEPLVASAPLSLALERYQKTCVTRLTPAIVVKHEGWEGGSSERFTGYLIMKTQGSLQILCNGLP